MSCEKRKRVGGSGSGGGDVDGGVGLVARDILECECKARKLPCCLQAVQCDESGKWTAAQPPIKGRVVGDTEGYFMMRSDECDSKEEALENVAAKILARWKKNRIERLSQALRDWALQESKEYTHYATRIKLDEVKEALDATFFEPTELDKEHNACQWTLARPLMRPFHHNF